MPTYVESLADDLSRQLIQSSQGFLRLGLNEFHKQRLDGYRSIQPPIANLAIAIELMFKAIIAARCPLLLLENPPLELQIALSSKSLPKGFNWRKYDVDLRAFAIPTIGLEKATAIFYFYFENHRQELQPHLKLLAKLRNPAIHGALPSFQKHDLERLAYVSLLLVGILKEEAGLKTAMLHWHTKDDQGFLKTFDQERIDRVQQKLEKAKRQSRSLEHDRSYLSIDSWNAHVTNCPVCKSDATVFGTTDESWMTGHDGSSSASLTFFADSFKCDDCGLVLEDPEELRLAGVSAVYDRDVDLPSWWKEHGTTPAEYEYPEEWFEGLEPSNPQPELPKQ